MTEDPDATRAAPGADSSRRPASDDLSQDRSSRSATSTTLGQGQNTEPSGDPDPDGDQGPESGLGLGRFRLGKLLGEGGMGRVYEAWDPRLKRQVAIKLLRSLDRQMVQRFVREARLQAGIAHPGVCPIYEVGEADGSPYIVMQLLQARPLDVAAASLPLEQKLVLLRQTAEAIHEAHRTGLVHRDLKPANILVETLDDRPPRPFVVDFGLAKPLADRGLTEAGAVVGTPAYMAPEQVEGRLELIDRRTDVYGLGASLYRLLAGRSPFVFEGPASFLAILEDDPPPLVPAGERGRVPEEVQWIVAKCLAKDPARRYPSARALADDLGRYLDGETVEARPVSRWYRTVKRIRRHKALSAVTTLLVLVVIAFLAWGVHSARRAAEREALARELTEQVEEVEALVRYSRMSPLHDVRPDRALIRHRMAGIRLTMERAGDLGRAAGLSALGRGHLALGELDAAIVDLRAAWDAGQRDSATAAALARALSAVYRERLASIELVWDWPTRQRHRDQLERTYGEPARQFLGLSLGRGLGDPAARGPTSADDSALAALDHLHHDRFEDALRALEVVAARRPWGYELARLEGDIQRTWAIAEAAEGRAAHARDLLATADAAYRRAVEIAESAPDLRLRRAQTAFLALSLAQLDPGLFDSTTAEGGNLQRLLDGGRASVTAAIEADPSSARAWLWSARLERQDATGRQGRGEDPTALLDRAIRAAQRAVGLDPEMSAAWSELGRAHWGWAQWERSRGSAAAERVGRALEALGRVAPVDRDYTFHINQARAYQALAAERIAVGEPAGDAHPQTIEAFRRAIGLHSAPFAAWVNLGSSLLAWVESGEAADPMAVLDDASNAFEAARDLRPEHPGVPFYLGRTLLLRARGGNAASGLLDLDQARQAIGQYERAAELGPSLFQPHNGLGEAHQLLAVAAWDRGRPTDEHLEAAERHYGKALELAPASPGVLANLAWVAYFRGKHALRQGLVERPFFQTATDLAERAAATGPLPGAALCLASIDRLRAEARTHAGLAPGTPADAARRAFESLLVTNPRHAEAHRSMARLLTLEARWQRTSSTPGAGGNSTLLAAARDHLDQAVALQPRVASFWLADARWYLEAAIAGGSAEQADAGLESARRALDLRPGWAEAEAVAGALGLVLARLDPSRSPADVRDGADGPGARLNRALRRNPHLTHRWGSLEWLDLPAPPKGTGLRDR